MKFYSDEEKEKDLRVFYLIRDEIHQERSLVGQRISWFIVSQSCLLTAFAISLNPIRETAAQEIIRKGLIDSQDIPEVSKVLNEVALITSPQAIDPIIFGNGIQYIGWLTALLAFLGIISAVIVQNQQLIRQRQIIQQIKDRYGNGPCPFSIEILSESVCAGKKGRSFFHWLAMIGPCLIPIFFLWFWSILLG